MLVLTEYSRKKCWPWQGLVSIVVSRDSLQETAISALDCLDSDDWAKQIKVIRQTLLLHCTLHTATVVLVPVRKLQVTVVCKLNAKHVK